MHVAFWFILLLAKMAPRPTPLKVVSFCARRMITRRSSHQPLQCAMWLSEVEGGWLDIEVVENKQPSRTLHLKPFGSLSLGPFSPSSITSLFSRK
jgi:hypothetical protein